MAQFAFAKNHTVQVSTPLELKLALDYGEQNILITEHLDLREMPAALSTQGDGSFLARSLFVAAEQLQTLRARILSLEAAQLAIAVQLTSCALQVNVVTSGRRWEFGLTTLDS